MIRETGILSVGSTNFRLFAQSFFPYGNRIVEKDFAQKHKNKSNCVKTGSALINRHSSHVMTINLLYHDVALAGEEDSSGFAGPEAARYKLTPDDFERHLAKIKEATTRLPIRSTVEQEWTSACGGSWSITFDDGGLSSITAIAPLLERHDWRGWFFIATDYIGQNSFCSADQIRDLHQRGHVIGSHSASHPERISDCSWDELCDEWSRSVAVLSEIVGEPVTTASVPGGFYSASVARAAAEAGIRILFNSEPTTYTSIVDGMLVLGRYNIYRGMPPEDAALLIKSPFRRWRQSAFWNLKKVAKVVARPLYKTVRRKVLSASYSK